MATDSLPIFESREALLSALKPGARIILRAPTGSGKSTQVPQMILDAGLAGKGRILLLQPRRLATRMLANRVSQERNSRLGQEVGYQIRFENVSSPSTKILFVTEGILLRRMMSDPSLAGTSVLIFDEFHERHLEADIALARALDLQATHRPDLIIIVMSATLDSDVLQRYLQPAQRIESEGRTFPVEIRYLPKPVKFEEDPPWEVAARECARLTKETAEGDILVFMPGSYEIQRTIRALENTPETCHFLLLPLHGELPPEAQDAAVQKSATRKIIVSTNVAETSLTIDGVRIVIDSGLARIARYDPHRGIDTLLIENISRASADQRAGRAGRTAPGICLRLWTSREHENRAVQQLPEIKRMDLAEVALSLKCSGISDLRTFRWLEPPHEKSIEEAESLLSALGAVVEVHGEVTEMGRRMSSFPAHPRYARMLLAAESYGCVRSVCLIAALTQTRNILVRSNDKGTLSRRSDLLGEETDSDFFLLMRAWRYAERVNFDPQRCRSIGVHGQSARSVRPLLEAFLKIAAEQGLPIPEKEAPGQSVRKAVLAGFSDRLAIRLDGGTHRCQLSGGRRGVIAPESHILNSPLILTSEINEIEGRDKELSVKLCLNTAVEEEWLRELFPNDFADEELPVWDATQKRVFIERRTRFRDLVLRSTRKDATPCDAVSDVLAREIADANLAIHHWDDRVEQWILRVNQLAAWCPETGIAPIAESDRAFLVRQLCDKAIGYKEVKDHPVWPVLKTWLSDAQASALDALAPERYPLPGGRQAKITYQAALEPKLGARIQDLYGVTGDLTIAMGRVSLTIEILGPNFRPLQVTRNLANFWKETYPKIKPELQRKYPKHEWR